MTKKLSKAEKVRKEVIDNLSQEDVNRLKEQQDYGMVDKESDPVGFRIAVANDTLYRQLGVNKMTIGKAMFDLRNLVATKQRLEVELKKGKITRELRPGVPMTKDEIQAELFYLPPQIEATILDMHPVLGKMRGLVGHHKVNREVVLTMEEFNAYVLQLEQDIKKLGYDLFED